MFMIGLLLGLIYYIPALVANGSAPFIKSGTPIDFKRKLNDGRRVLGDGKTFEGLLLSLTFGTTVGAIISRFLGIEWIIIGFVESLGAMLGDMLGAFIKRRIGLERGARAPILDQLDFILGATVVLISFKVNLNIYQVAFVCVLVIALHMFTNYMAYRLKIKSVPW
ncbi:hypothetical protein SUSAZ_04095 [Sulfolobus acidocaldarius SUSAZ]|nr:hypothetical protein SUSAZ_04095 [Sulfolobus acidocaldarius SUSAZ]